MSFMGMGFLEILTIFLIGFVLVGPERMMEMGQKAGKMLGELRRMSESLQESISMTDFEDGDPSMMRNITSSRPPSAGAKSGGGGDGPVSFRPGSSSGEPTKATEPETGPSTAAPADASPTDSIGTKDEPEGHERGPDQNGVAR
jgi:Sec-independent protein translocase protein TatA